MQADSSFPQRLTLTDHGWRSTLREQPSQDRYLIIQSAGEIRLRWGLRSIDWQQRALCDHPSPIAALELPPIHYDAMDPVALRGAVIRELARVPVCTENLIRVDDVMESPKLAE
jgi:hypothetical protein